MKTRDEEVQRRRVPQVTEGEVDLADGNSVFAELKRLGHVISWPKGFRTVTVDGKEMNPVQFVEFVWKELKR